MEDHTIQKMNRICDPLPVPYEFPSAQPEPSHSVPAAVAGASFAVPGGSGSAARALAP